MKKENFADGSSEPKGTSNALRRIIKAANGNPDDYIAKIDHYLGNLEYN